MSKITAQRFLMITDRLAKQYESLLAFEAANTPSQTQATLTINPSGSNNALKFTATVPGSDANNYTISYVDPAAINQSLTLSKSGYSIVISLATNGSGTITSTANSILAAVNASSLIAPVVTASLDTTADVGNTGSGVVTAMSAASLSGGLHGLYGYIIQYPQDQDLTIPMAFAGQNMDTYLTASQIVQDSIIWSNLISALRAHLTAQGQSDLIDGFLVDNSIRVHENFDTLHYLTQNFHLLAVNVFKGTTGDVAVITLGDTGTASLNLNPVGAKAKVTIDPTGADNALTFTAATAGVGGNSINVTYRDPGTISATLSVDVQGYDIVVNLATNGSGVITTTAANIATAIAANTASNALVTVTAPGLTTGLVTAVSQTYLTNRNTSLTYSAVTPGSEGNKITVQYTNPGSLTASTTVAVTLNAINVTLSHDGTNITATATDVKTAIENSTAASALVGVTAVGDITGVVSAVSATNLTGGASSSITASTPLGIGTGTASSSNYAPQKFQVLTNPAQTQASVVVYPTNAKAFVTINPANANYSRVKYTAVTAGTGGNSITITYTYTQAPSLSETVTVNGNNITVRLSTNSSSQITSTVSSVVSSVNGSGAASALVTASAVDTGSNVINSSVAQTYLTNTSTQIKYTAVASGASGDNINIVYVNPGVLTASTTSSTVGNTITVTLSHNGTIITATANDVLTAVLADASALLLVTPTLYSTAGDGIVAAVSATYLKNGSGTTLKRNTVLNLTLLKSDLSTVVRSLTIPSGTANNAVTAIGAVKASLILNPSGNDNAVYYEAVTAGTAGNSITISYVNPAIPLQALSVGVVGTAITVNLATDNNGRPVSTADQVISSVNGSGAASALVTASNSAYGHGYVSAYSATNLSGGYEIESYLSLTGISVTGGEKGDVFKVQNIVDRTITY
jgi:hypothetical protein